VGGDEVYVSAFVDGSVEVDDVVVAYAFKTSCAVPLVDVGYGEGFAFGGG
jgi:hypothetical protein